MRIGRYSLIPQATIDIAQIGAGIVLTLALVAPAFGSDAASMIVTSDIHLSSPAGRWPEDTRKFADLLRVPMVHEASLLFIVGDVVDNVVRVGNHDTAGDRVNWQAEYAIFAGLMEDFPGVVRYSYGPGHDFGPTVPLDYVVAHTGLPARGVYRWNGIDLIWVTIRPASFPGDEPYPAALPDADYIWLSEQLAATDSAILLWHVPLRTQETANAALALHGTGAITIPQSDRIFRIVERYRSRIALIVNGHVHVPVSTTYDGIPLLLCPFVVAGCYCEIRKTPDRIDVTPQHCGLDPFSVVLPAHDTGG